jgi:hypothetical protein
MSTIIGIGTPRSGTRALATLLQDEGLDVTHESSSSIDWNREHRERRYGETKQHLRDRDGDVAYWLTQAAHDLLDEMPRAVVIALKRPKTASVHAMMENLSADRLREARSLKGFAFPTFKQRSVQEGWKKYWELYREQLGSLKGANEDRVLEVQTTSLDEEETRERVCDFLNLQSDDT